MISSIWNTVLYEPLYNFLVFLINVVPWGDVGIAVIILTIIVKLILFPLSQKAVRGQIKLKELNPELEKIKKDFPDKQIQFQKNLELYKKAGANPFSGCLVMLVQFPIIIALYYVFLRGLEFTGEHLYSFVSIPENYSINFIGLIDMHDKSLILALLAGITQFVQAKLNAPIASNTGDKDSFQAQFAQSMQVQVKYVLPIFIAFVSYKISAAIALYWTVSNLFTIGQEIYIRRKFAKEKDPNKEIANVVIHNV